MQEISGRAPRGGLTVILGPRQSGKTALLAALSGRVLSGTRGKQSFTGHVSLDGAHMHDADLRSQTGLVHKHETLYRSQTVRQSLEFAVKLRALNYPMSAAAIKTAALVDDLVASLGLDGKVRVPALSAKHKKLLAIGIELAALPRVLFLDEPLSGLDAESAWTIVRVLKAAAKVLNLTVIATVDQPPGEIFAEFGHLIFLGKGACVYQGPRSGLEGAFAAKGFKMPPRSSPSDFALLVIRNAKFEDLPRDTSEHGSGETPHDDDDDDDGHGGGMAPLGNSVAVHSKRHGVAYKFVVQVALIAAREARAVPTRFLTVIVICFLATLLSLLFMNGANQASASYSLGAEFGGLVLTMLAAALVQSLSYGSALAANRPVFIQERSSGLYWSTAYVLGQLMVEAPLNFATASLWFLITYFSIGWQGRLIYFIAVAFFVLMICTSMVLMLSSLMKNAAAGLGLVPLIIAPQLLFMGTFVRIQQMTPILSWVANIAFLKYAMNLMAVEEFNTPCNLSPAYCGATGQWASLLALNNFVQANVWWYALVLGAFLVFFRSMGTMLLLRRLNKAMESGMA